MDMDDKDLERLKAVCEKEGFELRNYPFNDHEVIVAKKKDIWDGVEFAEDSSGHIWLIRNPVFTNRDAYKPSTEQAYVEQLKKEAFKRFGEIKEGDRFDRTSVNPIWGDSELATSIDVDFYLEYDKKLDRFFAGNLCIYESGKWATKVPKRVEVSIEDSEIDLNKFEGGYSSFIVEFIVSKHFAPTEEVKDNWQVFLAKQLEEYLNKPT